MIIDVALFSAEAEMLLLRWLTLQDVCDHGIAVAATRTHQGQPADRGLIEHAFFQASRRVDMPTSLYWVQPEMVVRKDGRIYERSPDERGPAGSIWFQTIERQHRHGMRAAVHSVTSDPLATILLSDVDEIPTPHAVRRATALLAHHSEWLVCEQRFHSTALDLLHPYQPWYGTCIARLADLAPQAHRDARTTIGPSNQQVVTIDHGGWHLSWLGTDAERQRKLETFSHAELAAWDPVEARRTLHHVNGEPLAPISLEASWKMDWPAPLLDASFTIPDAWLRAGAWESRA